MRAAATWTFVLLSGCSLFATSRHPSVSRDGERTCDTYTTVAVDGLVGAAGLLLGGMAIVNDATSSSRDGWKGMGTLVGAGVISLTLPWTIGAVVGGIRVSACESELRAQRGP